MRYRLVLKHLVETFLVLPLKAVLYFVILRLYYFLHCAFQSKHQQGLHSVVL